MTITDSVSIMSEKRSRAKSIDEAFEWPECEPPHPYNLALACRLCATLLPAELGATFEPTHFPSGWSSNDVIQVAITSSTYKIQYIVKLPRLQLSSCITTSCEPEALRTHWAAKHGFGPKILAIDEETGSFAMEFVQGQTLTADMITQRMPQVLSMLRRIHTAEPASWMHRYDPMQIVRTQLAQVKQHHAMRPKDIRLIESIIRNAQEQVKNHPWVPCHNDFHSHNIMLRHDGAEVYWRSISKTVISAIRCGILRT